MNSRVPDKISHSHLDKEEIKLLLANADIKWFKKHNGSYDYRGHVEFAADYIAKNYGRKKPRC